MAARILQLAANLSWRWKPDKLQLVLEARKLQLALATRIFQLVLEA